MAFMYHNYAGNPNDIPKSADELLTTTWDTNPSTQQAEALFTSLNKKFADPKYGRFFFGIDRYISSLYPVQEGSPNPATLVGEMYVRLFISLHGSDNEENVTLPDGLSTDLQDAIKAQTLDQAQNANGGVSDIDLALLSILGINYCDVEPSLRKAHLDHATVSCKVELAEVVRMLRMLAIARCSRDHYQPKQTK